MGELRNQVKNLNSRVQDIENQLRDLQENYFISRDEKTQDVNQVKYYYVVIRGRKTGIFTKWDGDDGADAQVKGFPDAYHKKFKHLNAAKAFLQENI